MRALIFTTHPGGGHDAAAHAMEQALSTRAAGGADYAVASPTQRCGEPCGPAGADDAHGPGQPCGSRSGGGGGLVGNDLLYHDGLFGGGRSEEAAACLGHFAAFVAGGRCGGVLYLPLTEGRRSCNGPPFLFR